LANSKQSSTEKPTEAEIVENRLQRLQKQRNLQNEPVVFRNISFGAHIGSVKKKRKMEFIRTGYEIPYEEAFRTQITQIKTELPVDGIDVSISYPEQHRCMSCLSQNGKRAKIYEILGDRLSIGSIPLQSIFYHFYEDRFCGVEIRFDGKHWFDMEKLFFSKYGEKEDRLDARVDWHIWEGESIYIKLWTVPKNQTEERGFIEYCYLPLRQQDQERYAREMLRWTKHRDQRKRRSKSQPLQ
jgi:hypothetical protein